MYYRNLFFIVTGALLLVSCGKETQETSPIRKDVTESVFASGFLEAEGKYFLQAQSNGYISRISIDEGDIVSTGDVIAEIEDPDAQINFNSADQLLYLAQNNTNPTAPLLQQAEMNISIAKDKMNQDQLNLERYERLWKKNSVAKVEYENAKLQLETSQNNYQIAIESYEKVKEDAEKAVITNESSRDLYASMKSKSKIKVLEGGKVYKKYKSLGDYVRTGDIIAEIANHDLIYAKVNIDESSIAKLSVGQPATIQLNTQTERVYQAKVEEILPSFDDATQSFLVKLYFTEPLDFKILNTQLQANIQIGDSENVILIPRNFIDFGGYVQIKGLEEKTKVKTKFVSNEWVQVLEGVTESDVLVTDNINPEN